MPIFEVLVIVSAVVINCPYYIKNVILLTTLMLFYNTPRGIRIPVTSVKGKCPRPLDDGGNNYITIIIYTFSYCQWHKSINIKLYPE